MPGDNALLRESLRTPLGDVMAERARDNGHDVLYADPDGVVLLPRP